MTNKEKAEQILSNLRGRKGLLEGWYDIDEDIREEIVQDIVDIIGFEDKLTTTPFVT